jgi:prepilin-type N-terminal cleavage/methylation domain-containing protein
MGRPKRTNPGIGRGTKSILKKVKNRGFTMVEVLLALTIGGLVLVAATALLITISQAWANRPATRDAFDAHVNGVEHFLLALLDDSSLPEQPNSAKEGEIIDLQNPIGFSDIDDPLVSFFLKEAPPLLFNPHGKSVKVRAYLYPEEGDALSLLWFSELQELEKDEKGNLQPVEEEALMKTIISPFYKEVYYYYWGEEDHEDDDIKTWEISSDLLESEKKDGFRIPEFMKLVFSSDDEDLERIISLPIKRLSPSGIEPEPKR